MTIDKAREYTVIVNNGSGVIFQPFDPDSTYILTAKHNIENAGNLIDDLIRFRFDNERWESIEIPFEFLEEGVSYFPHPDKDIAIVKITRLEDLDTISRFDNVNSYKDDLFVVGYPETRRKANIDDIAKWFRVDPGVKTVSTTADLRIEATVPANPGLDEMSGHSGGAVVLIAEGRLYLTGVQNSMARAKDEQLGRIEFTPINQFDEIIKLYADQLQPLLPAYLSNFSFLRNEAFDLRAGWDSDDVIFTKNFLRDKCLEVINNEITPIGIKNLFKERLLIDTNRTNDLECKTIWLLWLEFLTIMNITKEKIHSVDELSDLFNHYRLFCSDTDEDWSSELENLVYSDYRGLKKDGLVIVGVKKSPELETYIIDPQKIPLITQARKSQNFDKIKIDDGFGFPYDEYKFIHIDYFKKALIVDKRKEYVQITDRNVLLEKLKQLYGEVIIT